MEYDPLPWSAALVGGLAHRGHTLAGFAAGAAGGVAAPLHPAAAANLGVGLVPARFVGVDALPITVNGKLDETALPAPSAAILLPDAAAATSDPAGPAPGAAADDPLEERIAGMVCELLKLPSIDPDDNIFLVGGHSMLAMQVVSRIKQTFGVRLSLRQVFEEPTVAGITATVAARMPGAPVTARGGRS